MSCNQHAGSVMTALNDKVRDMGSSWHEHADECLMHTMQPVQSTTCAQPHGHGLSQGSDGHMSEL